MPEDTELMKRLDKIEGRLDSIETRLLLLEARPQSVEIPAPHSPSPEYKSPEWYAEYQDRLERKRAQRPWW